MSDLDAYHHRICSVISGFGDHGCMNADGIGVVGKDAAVSVWAGVVRCGVWCGVVG